MSRPRGTTDSDLVAFIRDYHDERGYPPSVREIAAGVGMSRAGVQDRLRQLVDDGVLTRPPGVSRAIRVSPAGMKMITERL